MTFLCVASSTSKAGTSVFSVGIDGDEMSSAPDFSCCSRSTSLPSCSDGKTRTVSWPFDFFVTLSANSWYRSNATSPGLFAWPKRSVVCADAPSAASASVAAAARRTIGVGRAFLRQLVWGLLGAPCYLGYLMYFTDRSGRQRALHEQAASSVTTAVPRQGFGAALGQAFGAFRR